VPGHSTFESMAEDNKINELYRPDIPLIYGVSSLKSCLCPLKNKSIAPPRSMPVLWFGPLDIQNRLFANRTQWLLTAVCKLQAAIHVQEPTT
jgi:hypothetical protein